MCYIINIMKKINIQYLIISLIIGIILGAITEYALVYDMKPIIKITQSYNFWGIIMIMIAIIGKGYINSIIGSSLNILGMNATYYLIRLNMSGYTNIGAWKTFSMLGIAFSIYIGMIIYIIKEKIKKNKINDKIPICTLVLMTFFAITFSIIYIANGLRFFIKVYFLYMPGVYGIYLGAIIGTILGYILNKKKIEMPK